MGQGTELEGGEVLRDDVHRQMVSLLGIGPVDGRAKLQGMFFLVTYKVPEAGPVLRYAPGRHGPYSEVVGDALEHLVAGGMITEGPGGISLTDRGREAGAAIRGGMDPWIMRLLGAYRDALNDLTGDELLAFMYTLFPDMAAESEDHDRIMSDLEPLVMALVKKEKISSGRAAELLGVTQDKIFNNMRRMGIQIFY